MKEEGSFSYLQGYCPLDRVKDIIDLAKQEELGYAIEDPHESEEIPTLIRNPMWIRIISPVFKFMNVIPGYKEYDISIWFLRFNERIITSDGNLKSRKERPWKDLS